MADRVPTGDPAAEIPELSGELAPPAPQLMPQTLAGELVPVADDIRELYSEFGLRPYRVFLVHAMWSGGRRGIGDLVITSRREILPVPRVRDIDSVRRSVEPTGLTEQGEIVIDQISPKYAEDDLVGRTPDVTDMAMTRTARQDVEFWWEVEEARASAPRSIRRFSPPAAAPMLSRGGLHWRVTLVRQGYDRARAGEVGP